jgi:hypothetical protein
MNWIGQHAITALSLGYSSILPISPKQITSSHIKLLKAKKDHDINTNGNADLGFEQSEIVEELNRLTRSLLLIIGSSVFILLSCINISLEQVY